MAVDLLFTPVAVHHATHVTVRDRRRTRYIVPRPAGPRRASLDGEVRSVAVDRYGELIDKFPHWRVS